MMQKDAYKYHVMLDGKVVHRGITYNFEMRECEHQRTWPGCRLKQIGDRVTWRDALIWERQAGKRSFTR